MSEKVKSRLGWPLIQVMVNTKYKVLYSPIAKNANTSLKRTFVRFSDLPDKEAIIASGVHRFLDNNYTGFQLWDLPKEQVDEILADPDYFSFVVLREPYERLVSVYVEKFIMHRFNEIQWQHIGPVMAAIQGCAVDAVSYETGVSFRDFVEYLIGLSPIQHDPHWRPQYMYLSGVPYTHVYTLGDMQKLREDLSRHTGMDIEIEHANSSKGGREKQFIENAVEMNSKMLSGYSEIDSKSFYDEQLFNKIRRYFALDYTLYGMASSAYW